MNGKPYPEITVSEPNPAYAREILSNLGGKDSEMSAISLYLYDHFVTFESDPDLSATFLRISKTEMHHLDLFGKLAVLLGADPRLWEYKGKGKRAKDWSPGYIRYSRKPRQIISNALFSEYMAIEKYQRQMKTIKDPHITAILERIIEDEREHVEIFKGLLTGGPL